MELDIEKITKLVADKSGITVEQAQKAVTVVFEQLKDKMPEFGAKLKEYMPEVDKLLKETPLAGIRR